MSITCKISSIPKKLLAKSNFSFLKIFEKSFEARELKMICLLFLLVVVAKIGARDYKQFRGYKMAEKAGLVKEKSVEFREVECLLRVEPDGGYAAVEFHQKSGECSTTRCGRVTLEPDPDAVVFVDGTILNSYFHNSSKWAKFSDATILQNRLYEIKINEFQVANLNYFVLLNLF